MEIALGIAVLFFIGWFAERAAAGARRAREAIDELETWKAETDRRLDDLERVRESRSPEANSQEPDSAGP